MAFAIRLSTGLVSYLLFAAVARSAGPEQFGVFSIMFSAAMLIGTAGSFGQQMFLVKEIPQSDERGQSERAAGALAFSFIITAVFSAIGGLIYAFAAPAITGVHLPLALAAGAGVAVLYAISQTTTGVLRIQERTLFAITSRDLLWRLMSIAGIGLAAWLAEPGLVEAHEALLVLAIALLPVLAVHFAVIAPYGLRRLKEAKPRIAWKAWLETSTGLAVVGVIASADLYLYTIVLGAIMPTSETGAFFAALKTVELLNLFLIAVTLVIAPQLSRLVGKNDPVALQRKCNAAIVLQSTPTILSALVMIAAAPLFMWLFDPSFVTSSDLLRLLVIGMLINALAGATGLMLQLSGSHWLQVVFQGGSLLIAIIALPPLVAAFGVYGAAISFIISKLLWNVLALVVIRLKLHVDPSILGLFDRRTGGLSGLKADILAQLNSLRVRRT